MNVCVQLGHFRAALDDAHASLVHSAGTFTKAYLRQGAALEGAHNSMQHTLLTQRSPRRAAALNGVRCCCYLRMGFGFGSRVRVGTSNNHSAHKFAYIRTHARSCSCRCAFSIWSGRLIFLVVLLDRIACTVPM